MTGRSVSVVAGVSAIAAIVALLAGAGLGCALARPAATAIGPVCIGLIVTGCSAEPRTSPALFLLILILGAVAVQWMSLQARAERSSARHPIEDDPTRPGSRRPDEEEQQTQ